MVAEIEQKIKTQTDLRNKELEATINKTINEQLTKLQETIPLEVVKMITDLLTTQMGLQNTNITHTISQTIFQNQLSGNVTPIKPTNQTQLLTPTYKPNSTTIIIIPAKKFQ